MTPRFERVTLITGGAGFVGTNLADRILRSGKPVRVLDDLSRPGVERNLEWLEREHGDRLQTEIVDLRDAAAVGRPGVQPQVTGRYRAGDIRHCFADIGLARDVLGFVPQEDFGRGLAELAGWLAGEVAVDRVDQATEELARRGLVA